MEKGKKNFQARYINLLYAIEEEFLELKQK